MEKARSDVLGEIERAEKELLEKKKELAELRRTLPKGEVTDYTFKTFDGEDVALASLFGDRDELLVIHNMGKSCRYCTLWADGFNGVAGHLNNRAAFVVVSPDDPKTQREFYESRGWKFNMVSAAESNFTKDMGFADKEGNPWPGVSTFEKSSEGKMYRTAKTSFGPGDDFCAVWHLFDLLPKGVNAWEPKYKY